MPATSWKGTLYGNAVEITSFGPDHAADISLGLMEAVYRGQGSYVLLDRATGRPLDMTPWRSSRPWAWQTWFRWIQRKAGWRAYMRELWARRDAERGAAA